MSAKRDWGQAQSFFFPSSPFSVPSVPLWLPESQNRTLRRCRIFSSNVSMGKCEHFPGFFLDPQGTQGR